MTRQQNTSGTLAIRWIEDYCLVPHGLDKGQRVRLTPLQRDIIRKVYDDPSNAPRVDGALGAYLALLHTCGPEAVKTEGKFQPDLSVDIFTVWGAVGPDLRRVLKREGERIVCPQLGTEWPAAA
jgi:hypothetical protein